MAEPAKREGAVVPSWPWKECRAHYTLHSTSNLVARHAMLRNLQSMRLQQEQRLVRVDNGEKELDRQGADVMLKVSLYACVCHVCVCHAKHALLTTAHCSRRSSPPSPRSVNCSRPPRRKREIEGHLRVYRVRMIPTPEQARELKRCFSAARHAYNATVAAVNGSDRANFYQLMHVIEKLSR